jgi:acyl carrier protein
MNGLDMETIKQDISDFLKSRKFVDSNTELKEDESLSEAGIIDSIGILDIIDNIENKYNLKIPVELIIPENFDTLNGMERLILQLKK